MKYSGLDPRPFVDYGPSILKTIVDDEAWFDAGLFDSYTKVRNSYTYVFARILKTNLLQLIFEYVKYSINVICLHHQ